MTVATDFLAGGGEMGRASCARKQWAETPLGPTEAWPQSLKTVLRILLTSRPPDVDGGGARSCHSSTTTPTDRRSAVKHGAALGAPAREVWKEIWPDVGPAHRACAGERRGRPGTPGCCCCWSAAAYPEENVSHLLLLRRSPMTRGPSSACSASSPRKTERIIGERRLATLRDPRRRDCRQNTAGKAVLAAAARQLGANLRDLPLYP